MPRGTTSNVCEAPLSACVRHFAALFHVGLLLFINPYSFVSVQKTRGTSSVYGSPEAAPVCVQFSSAALPRPTVRREGVVE